MLQTRMRTGCKHAAVAAAFAATSTMATAQTLDLAALQSQADQAIAQAQQELQSTEALVRFTRDDQATPWSISITGMVAGTPVDYAGIVSEIRVQDGVPTLVLTPPAPTFTASADLCTPMLRAGAAVLSDASPFLTELYFDISAPLEDTADPDRFKGVDLETLPPFTMFVTTRTSPLLTMKDWVTGIPLTPAGSYFSLATDFGLTREDVQDFLGYRLNPDQTVDAFRAGAITLLGDLGISEASASTVFDIRRSLGRNPTYFRQAFNYLLKEKEPVQGIIGDGLNFNDPNGVLARVQDPGDIEIELSGEAEVEVSVPPFVSVKVTVGVTVRGKASQLTALQEVLDDALSKAKDQAKELAEEQLETLRNSIQELVDMFKQYIDNLQMPNWVKWLLR